MNSNNTSEMKNLIRFYFHIVSRQMLWYPIVSLVLTLFIILTGMIEPKIGVVCFSWIQSVLIYMWCFAPLVFNRVKSRALLVMLPAKPSEKAWITIGYTMIVVPILLGFFPGLLLATSSLMPAPLAESCQLYLSSVNAVLPSLPGYSLLNNLVPPLVALLVVLTCRGNIVGKTIAWVLGTNFLYGFLGGVAGGIMAFSNGINTVLLDKADLASNPVEIIVQAMPGLSDFIFWMSNISIVIAIILTIITYRRIVNCQA